MASLDPLSKPIKWKHLYLLCFLVLFLAFGIMGDLAKAVVTTNGLRILLLIVFSGVLLAAVYSESDNPFAFNINSVLMLTALISDLLHSFVPLDGLRVLSLLLGLAFLVVVIVSMLRTILTARGVSADLIFSSMCVYLILGIGWAMIYALVELAIPGSFSTPTGPLSFPDDIDVKVHAMYFSFVTLTTLGYGDIFPSSSPAHFFAILESLSGQTYLTVLVARLVGLQIATSGNSEESR